MPPIDVLPSLSRLMNAGIGAAHTVPEHRKWADQLYAIYARGREARMMVAIVGEAGLQPADRRALEFADAFEVSSSAGRRPSHALVGWRLLERSRADLLRLRRHGRGRPARWRTPRPARAQPLRDARSSAEKFALTRRKRGRSVTVARRHSRRCAMGAVGRGEHVAQKRCWRP
jgi:hypothetical protein